MGIAANKRGGSSFGYFILSIVISPVLSLLTVLILKSKTPKIQLKNNSAQIVCINCKIPYSNDEKFCCQCGGKLPEIHSSNYTYKLEKTRETMEMDLI